VSYSDASDPSHENSSDTDKDLDRPKMPSAAYIRPNDVEDPARAVPGDEDLQRARRSVGVETTPPDWNG
jgi:hypothetical protein